MANPFLLLITILGACSLQAARVSAEASPHDHQLRAVPLPAKYSTGNGSTPLCLSPSFTITLDSQSFVEAGPKDLVEAIKRTAHRLSTQRMKYLSPSGGREFWTDDSGQDIDCHSRTLQSLLLAYTHADVTVGNDAAQRSIFSGAVAKAEDRPDLEAYTLSIPLSGEATITSASAIGLFRGLTTFEQLFYYVELPAPAYYGDGDDQRPFAAFADQPGKHRRYAPLAPYDIEDRPAFGWRGVLLDTSRNWFGLAALEKMLDTMTMAKLNVFHWHITDSNSWPLDLDDLPELASRGAYSPSQRYTEEDVQYIIRYAGERGIDVVLEVDTPGHTAIVAESHPEHVACYLSPFTGYAPQPPAGQLRYATRETVEWTTKLFASIVKLLGRKGERSPYLSTGGDEISLRCMEDDPVTIASLKKDGRTLDQALDHFVKSVHAPIRAARRTPVVWHEMALNHGPMPSLGNDTIVDVWADAPYAQHVVEKGFRVVMAVANYFYLDCGHGGWINTAHGSPSWCEFKTWQRMFSFDPFVGIQPQQRKQVLGGQACLWAEQSDENNLESIMWPRAAVVGELFWTGEAAGEYPRNALEALPRMHDLRYRMVERGVKATPLQPHWCALRPELCAEGM